MGEHIFISHSSKNDDTVKKLRETLELEGFTTWVDSREFSGGDILSDTLTEKIKTAKTFIALLSIEALSSSWVQKELKLAHKVAQERKEDGYKVISLIMPGVPPGLLTPFFPKEPIHIFLDEGPGGPDLDGKMPNIFAALGRDLPNDWKPGEAVQVEPVAELILRLTNPVIRKKKGVRRAEATATLTFIPPDRARQIQSLEYNFRAPIGPIQLEEIRWYLESYFQWPTGVFKTRAEKTESELPEWGKLIFEEGVGAKSAIEPFTEWKDSKGDRRFSVWVNDKAPEGSTKNKTAKIQEAASQLLSLPWEIMHDDTGYLSQGGDGVRVRRRLPNLKKTTTNEADLPIRVLLISPRPEIAKEGRTVGYFDHRSSAEPLVRAVENLGENLVKVDILTPPTFPAMLSALKRAVDEKDPYDIVHFDGHGVFDKKVGLGALCFE
ncbi:TIR domain-containing protein, partial [Candidatus Poribacteria bacterium]|nr:TIR domain-containing protein [Candidatus Poribacteria bacterium]